MEGSEKYAIVIGKSKRPRCFRRGEEFPLQYHSNNKTWMTRTIWTENLKWFDKEMVEQGRHVIMFVDNSPCHCLESGAELLNITIRFLPANTTSVIQPLDMGDHSQLQGKISGHNHTQATVSHGGKCGAGRNWKCNRR